MPMAYEFTKRLTRLEQHAHTFALEHIASRPGLASGTIFPLDLWEEMGRVGLLGIGIPKKYGGEGEGYLGITAIGRTLARRGRCLGIVLSWLMHQITARFLICGFASDSQQQAYLPDMATGKVTMCIALSEPGVGGHPKHLATSAEKQGKNYRLTGEKAFLTNGPIAGVYIVFAVTGHSGARKRFSAFIVPRSTSGLTVTAPVDFGFLRPCPHGGIILDSCMIPETSVLGRIDNAYEDMALLFREVEDTLMMGPVLGAEEAQLEGLITCLKARMLKPSDEIAFLLGKIRSSLCTLELIAFEAAGMLETSTQSEQLAGLIISFRHLSQGVISDLKELHASIGIHIDSAYLVLASDLEATSRFAESVSRLKQIKLGAALFSGGNSQ
jgi:hypothetical protein